MRAASQLRSRSPSGIPEWTTEIGDGEGFAEPGHELRGETDLGYQHEGLAGPGPDEAVESR